MPELVQRVAFGEASGHSNDGDCIRWDATEIIAKGLWIWHKFADTDALTVLVENVLEGGHIPGRAHCCKGRPQNYLSFEGQSQLSGRSARPASTYVLSQRLRGAEAR